MLNLNSEKLFTIKMPIFNQDWIILDYHTDKGRNKMLVMAVITEDQEQELDNGKLKLVTANGVTFEISKENSPIYGLIDFNTNSNDFKTLENISLFDCRITQGIAIPSDYDYKTHCCNSPIPTYRYYDTTNPALILQYKHACLNKPERVCIFKYKSNVSNRFKGIFA